MRCIEMAKAMMNNVGQIRLTLTWDVLKYRDYQLCGEQGLWLTLTWDVLKCTQQYLNNYVRMD